EEHGMLRVPHLVEFSGHLVPRASAAGEHCNRSDTIHYKTDQTARGGRLQPATTSAPSSTWRPRHGGAASASMASLRCGTIRNPSGPTLTLTSLKLSHSRVRVNWHL